MWQPIKEVDTRLSVELFLCMYADGKLQWDSYIDYLSIALSRVIYLIRRLKALVEDNYLKMVYCSFFERVLGMGLFFAAAVVEQ